MMHEDGLVFSGPMTQPEAELWIQNMENHLGNNLVARKYEVQYALQYFTESAATWWKMHQAIQGCNGAKTWEEFKKTLLRSRLIPKHCDNPKKKPCACKICGEIGHTHEEHKDGFWVAPTVFTDVRPEMRIAKEEIFGPVTCIMKFTTYEEAIEIANGTDFGLVCGIYSKDFEKCWKVSKDVDAGGFFINHYNRASILGAPFGGVKDSGYGRERYVDTLKEFGTVKTRKFKTGLAPIPQWFAVDEVLADL